MALAAGALGLPPRALPSIQQVEGGAIGTVAHNKDGSDDLGLMQINSRWLPRLATATGQAEATVRAQLINEPCYNIAIGAVIFRLFLDEAHGDVAKAVAFYNTHDPRLGALYQRKVAAALISELVHELPASPGTPSDRTLGSVATGRPYHAP
jgi:soluble lytic murein transglycosylase-like protein